MVGTNNKITIWQQNVNKSPSCQHNLLSNKSLIDAKINIITRQEPAINSFHNTITAKDWTPIYPSTHGNNPDKTRAVTMIHSSIKTDTWNQLDFQSRDVTVVQLKGNWGKLTIFNIYNEGNSNDTVKELTKFHRNNRASLEASGTESAHILWLGDFNRHHPYWDDPNHTHLFTNDALDNCYAAAGVFPCYCIRRPLNP